MKLRLGLFERPYVEPPTAVAFEALGDAESRAAQALAERSLVLLENRGVLPLAPDVRRIAVLGPIADSARDLLGDYSHLVHMETLREMRTGVDALGVIGDGEVFEPGDELTGRRTILDAIRDAFADAEVVHARGSGISAGTDEELAEAVALARDADVAILVVGERSGLTDDSTTGEFRDRATLGLLGRQQELLEAVVATGTPVVLVVVSGRPLALPWAAEHCDAILLAWVPGDAGRTPSPTCSPASRTRAGSCRSRCPARSASCHSRTATTPPAAARTPRATTSTPRSRRCGRSASVARTRRSRWRRCASTGRELRRPATT